LLIEDYSMRNELIGENIEVGIIQGVKDYEDDYYKLFDMELDSRLCILNEKGKVVFLETIKNQRKINFNFLIDIMK